MLCAKRETVLALARVYPNTSVIRTLAVGQSVSPIRIVTVQKLALIISAKIPAQELVACMLNVEY